MYTCTYSWAFCTLERGNLTSLPTLPSLSAACCRLLLLLRSVGRGRAGGRGAAWRRVVNTQGCVKNYEGWLVVQNYEWVAN